MNGWILLHKKIWENELLKGNPYALSVWVWLLTHCDTNGIVTCGRHQIAKETGVKAETVRYWTTRFLQQNYQLTTIKTTNKFSTFQICNWQQYQKKTTNTTTPTLQQNYQPTTTNKQVNNKEKEEERESLYTHLKITKEEYNHLKELFPLKDVKGECDKANDWLPNSTKRYKDFPAFMRNWLRKVPDTKHKPNIFVPPVPINKDGLSKFKSMKESFNLNKGTL